MKHALRKTAVNALSDILPYTAYEITDAEYLGHVPVEKDRLTAELQSRGYHYQLFAAEKTLNGTADVGSWARIPSRHPSVVRDTGLQALNPRACQYHVHLFAVDGGYDLYGHYERHPYPHVPTLDLQRPLKHYRPTWDRDDNEKGEWTYLRGVTDPRIEPLLQ